MSLAAGSTLAHYQILSLLGKGGMGEVYRARDTKLKRDVALKIVPENFAADPDRLARFQREAELLASLNHPNIASIYGIETDRGRQALVLELIDGETLADRLRRGPMPVDEAVAVARQIADALESAHERGVIHRDLKPANVMLTPDGRIKVLDFGLATISQAVPGSSDSSNSPTLVSATGGGMLFGTAGYMSPEQARGRPTDRRSDVWAFGCVFYEMLTGRQLFAGETASDSIAKVLASEPDWNELQNFPAGIRLLLRRCLQKNPGKRLRDLGDALIELDDPGSRDTVEAAPVATPARRIWPVATAVLAVVSVILAVLYIRSRPESIEPIYLSIAPPEGLSLARNLPGGPALSPDGKSIAFTTEGQTEAGRTLWIRSLHAAEAREIEGSDGAAAPFWSPDSRWVGFFASSKLYRADVRGGKPQVICSLETNSFGRASASWNKDGTILFGLDTGRPLSKVPAEGGTAVSVTALDASRQELGHFRPQFLPDGRQFLFLSYSRNPENSGTFVGSLDGGAKKPLLTGSPMTAYFVPSGQLLFVRDSALFAQRFDPQNLQLQGDAVRIADSIFYNPTSAALSAFSVSDTGVLAYRTGDPNLGRQAQLTWFDRKGTRAGTIGAAGLNRNPRLAPDGERVALQVNAETPAVWILGPGAASTKIATAATSPVWNADGTGLVYLGTRDGKRHMMRKPVGEGGDEIRVEEVTPIAGHMDDLSPDGKYAVISRNTGTTNRDVVALSLTGDRESIPIAASQANELYGRLSPDGRWVAYTSNESGKDEIYVQAFPRAGSRTLVSRNGGLYSVWSRDGKELFYISTDRRKLMSVSISSGTAIQAGIPEPMFDINLTTDSGIGTPSHFDVSPDGKRFLIATSAGETSAISPVIHIVLNWPGLLQR